MITFHVTDLDSLIWYYKLENMSVDDMRSRILRTGEANEKMAMGTAWHKILEDPPDELITVEMDGYTFNIKCDAEIQLPQTREIRSTKKYLIDGEEVILTGGCDGISGIKITDHKLTFRENTETYFDSYQWRAYLDIYNASIFEYWLYSATQKSNEITINNISSIKMFRYPEMIKDLEDGIRNLLNFVKEYVPEHISKAQSN